MSQNPNEQNIGDILSKNHGKILECIYQFMKQKRQVI